MLIIGKWAGGGSRKPAIRKGSTMHSFHNPPPLTQTYARLQGKTVLITGATSGIGEAAVRLFAKEGASVVAAARRTDRLDALTRQLTSAGLSVASVVCDVRDETSVANAVAFAADRFGRLDGAFNNAGVQVPGGPIHMLDAETFDLVIGTNLKGVFLCLKHEVAAMLKTGGGAIVNTSSIGGLRGLPGNSIYAASKWGLAGLTRCAALDYARQGIRVNAIAPGPTRSEMFDLFIPTDEARAGVAAHTPMNYIAEPDDMARAALFLLTDEARWTTGIVLPCEGGLSA
jgi:NAD(P)-dependent dehydrogenase (short-subunit alcohol dehydrogenase family)